MRYRSTYFITGKNYRIPDATILTAVIEVRIFDDLCSSRVFLLKFTSQTEFNISGFLMKGHPDVNLFVSNYARQYDTSLSVAIFDSTDD